ncbi:MAG TPA: esterase-like activity of phytase family protein [Novosphingobium sp.]|nr:esterase-like activity of phytase family protein [Novosphingobium sp.]
MSRIIGSIGLIGLFALTWAHGKGPPPPVYSLDLQVEAVALPPARETARLGAFRLERIWNLRSRSMRFGGYSALVAVPGDRWAAISDGGMLLRFTPPDRAGPGPGARELQLSAKGSRDFNDVESATRDPATGEVWIGVEGRNEIIRLNRNFVMTGRARPRAMRDWGINSGPESLVRLADGRFLTLREVQGRFLAGTGNPGLLFPGDPVEGGDPVQFTLDGPRDFSVTDMAQMPDGRVLILMRRLIWPFPMRFASRLAIGDPSRIREGGVWHVEEVARLASVLPIDNMEAMAVETRADGRLDVWLMSDDNHADYQRTVLWRLSVDPAELPRPR